MKVYKIN